MKTDNTITLRDGRKLGYAEYGDPAGMPVLHFHGTPDSRLEGCLPGVDETARRLGVRLVLPDRPGLGLSDYQPNRRILDWPEDVLELADALQLSRFAVVGVSGGGPYASACAYRLPERVTRAGIISGVGPLDAPGAVQKMTTSDGKAVALGGRAPWLLRIVLWYSILGFRRDPQHFIDQVAAELTLPDQAVLSRPDVRDPIIRMTAAAFSRGARGPAWDYAVLAHPWGFRLEEISIPVCLWHGEDDRICPVGMGRKVAARIPGCKAAFFPGEGHFSVVVDHFEEILKSML